jgi:hypothetical protein
MKHPSPNGVLLVGVETEVSVKMMAQSLAHDLEMEGTEVEDCMLLQVDKEADMVADSTVNLSTYSAPIRVNSKFTSHMTLRHTWVQLQ